jgi:ribosomal protein S12 methylthiotransferase accessory factor YcaO
MPRYSWSTVTMNRAIRAAQRAGLPIERVEISTDGNITVHTAPVENAAPVQRNVARGSADHPTP